MEQLYAAYPLDHERNQIRLLNIAPDTWDNEINGTLSISSLDDNPEYIALSYAWGSPIIASTFTVTLQDHIVPVTENLHAALRRLRWHAYQAEHPKNLVIWADALCIFQGDSNEKQHQIPLMRRIYSQCEFTAIWLGELPQHILDGRKSSRTVEKIRDPVEGSIRLIEELNEDHHLTSIAPFDRDETDAYFVEIQKIFEFLAFNSWFKRRWVIQEAVLAPAVRVYFCEFAIDLGLLEKTHHTLFMDLFDPIESSSNEPRVNREEHLSSLHMIAYGFDEVEDFHKFPAHMETIEAVKIFAENILSNECYEFTYPSGGSWVEAWLRTLSIDCCRGLSSARRLTSEDYSLLLRVVSNKFEGDLAQKIQLAGGYQVPASEHLMDIMGTIRLTVGDDDNVLFYTQKGHIGVAQKAIMPGDRIYLPVK
ncbi:hypothetical protein N0V90_002852 [Kalmusia sp. IMI 367209]|nr:hypothetical protein N0V90_002852 [Kalmusia sp. IMI 367209]